MAERPFARRMLRCFGSAREKIMELWELLQAAAAANIGAQPVTLGWSRRRALGHGALALGAALSAMRASAQAVGPVMAELAAYMSAAAERTLPVEAVEHAKHHILDTFAAMVSGSELGPGRPRCDSRARRRSRLGRRRRRRLDAGPARRRARQRRRSRTPTRRTTRTAPSQSHPGCGGRAGGARARRRTRHRRDAFLPRRRARLRRRHAAHDGARRRRRSATRAAAARTRIAGTFGAAAAAGCVARLDAQQMRWLLDYASQQAAGYAVWGRDTDHIEKAFVFGGMPARNGVTAALLVRAGWNGVDDVFSGEDNFFQVNAPDGDPRVLVDAARRALRDRSTDIKKWTVGTPIQAPLDALESMRRKRPFAAEDVTERRRAAGADGRRGRGQPRHPGHLPAAHGGGDAARRDGVVRCRARQAAHAGSRRCCAQRAKVTLRAGRVALGAAARARGDRRGRAGRRHEA